MIVKICGITNREDALACVDAGASALGFNFYSKSPRCISPEAAAEIGRDLPVLKVGVFVNESPACIEEIAGIARLDIAQLHGAEQPSDTPRRRTWKAFRVRDGWNPSVLDTFPTAEAFLLDGPVPGSGEPFDWARASSSTGHRIILAGGLDASNVAAAINVIHPWGVDACSRLEKAPGVKDYDKVRRFVEAAMAVCL